MSLMRFNNVGIRGICACVPPRIIDNENFSPLYTEKEARKFIRSTGIKQRRFADEGVCGSDFCVQAGQKLLTDMKIDKNSIDILIYLTQTPDYMLIPPTSCTIQHRLGLAKSCGAFDINMNCSGFVFALSTAYAYAAQGMRVLLTVGETLSKVNSREDKTTGLLFGDAGAALLIESGADFGESCFSLNTDGGGAKAIIVEAGGYRVPASTETLTMREFPDGSRRNLHQARMDGQAVYDFTQREIVKDIEKCLASAGKTVQDIDCCLFHQANRLISDMFVMELGIEPDKVPCSIDRFGNTSTVSIPLGIAAYFGNDSSVRMGCCLMSAFGAGLSWGSCVVDINDCYVGKLEDYRK